MNRNFVFYDKIDFNWDSLYLKSISRLKETKNDYEVYLLIQEFVASLKGGRTNFYMPREVNKILRGIRMGTRMIENKVIITRLNSDILFEQGIKEGM